jgi:phosphoglycolate phosphatase-like HAD superfamily hydrolase
VLIVFDVDGTLTRTGALDRAAYTRALAETLGIVMSAEDWDACHTITDRGVAEEMLERRHGRRPDTETLRPLHDRFLTLLEEVLPEGETLQVPGAAALLARLRVERHTVAIATGCWEACARLKLGRARVPVDGIPLAACDHHPTREAILELAVTRAGGAAAHERIVYVGDAPWDVEATRRLGLPLVGVDHAARGRLAGLGVSTVLRDFTDADAFLHAVAAAVPPAPPA